MKKLLYLVVFAFTINATAQSALLRLNYNKGDKYTMNMKMSQDMGAVMSMDMTMKMSQEIKSVTGDEYVSEMKIGKITMDMSQGGMNMSYDSSKSDAELDQMGQMMKGQMEPMLKAVITAKGNNLGEVISTTVEPNTPGTSDLANQSSNVVYPKNKVKVGDTWDYTKSDKGMTMTFKYTVKSITSKNVVLAITGDVGGAASGTISGSMNIDRKSGVPTKSNINMDMDVQGQAMKTAMEMTMTKN
jgi:hypothetical protein